MQLTQTTSPEAISYLADSDQAVQVSSAACRLEFPPRLELRTSSGPQAGEVVAVRVADVNAGYPNIELTTGEEVHLNPGDIIIGALGIRKALRGFSGKVPDRIEKGQSLYLLNKGGIIGECTAFNRDLGWPSRVEYLGSVTRDGAIVNLTDGALTVVEGSLPPVPLVMVFGTCMNAGKTTVCKQILERFTEKNYSVNAGKVAGVACLQDPLKMKRNGAREVLSFHDFGLPSSAHVSDLAPVARSIIHYLAESKPDFIVLEMGDGILGGYQVSSLFQDVELINSQVCSILCANDLMGVWGSLEWIEKRRGKADSHPMLISGPVTDSAEGINYIEQNWNIPAANAFDSPGKICNFILKNLKPWLKLA